MSAHVTHVEGSQTSHYRAVCQCGWVGKPFYWWPDAHLSGNEHSPPTTCTECGNDDAAEGYELCTDCLEETS